MGKINITFIQYGGMTYRTVKNLACKLNKERFYVNYVWCRPGKDLYSNFKHPYPNEEDILAQTIELQENGVKLFEFHVKERYIPDPNLPWIETNFWDTYKEIKTDIVFSWRSGRQEYPFCHLKEPVVEWNVFGGYDPTPNLVKSLAISPLCKNDFVKNGGGAKKSEVVFLPLFLPAAQDNFRSELGIDSQTIVCGMHQRVEDTIFDTHSLDAIKYVSSKTNTKIDFVFLGGSKRYREYAQKIGLKGHFLESSQDYGVVSKFLNTLDIFTHARKDGETLGAAIQEAMIHGLPVISHTSQWNAHIDTIGPGGKVCETQDEYNTLLLEWVENIEKAREIGQKGKEFAETRYGWDKVLSQVESSFEWVYQNRDELLKNWEPLPLDMYKKRKLKYFIRFFVLQLVTKILVKLFGQGSTVVLVDAKNFFRKLLAR